MRWIIAILLVLLGLGYAATMLPSACPAPGGEPPDAWRRTAVGWELSTRWPTTLAAPALHPAVVAAMQGLLSALAMLAFDRPARTVQTSQRSWPKRSAAATRSLIGGWL